MLETATATSRLDCSHSRNQFASGMVLGISYDFHSAAASEHCVTLGYGFGSIVGSLGLYIRADFPDQRPHIGLVENNDGIHGCPVPPGFRRALQPESMALPLPFSRRTD